MPCFQECDIRGWGEITKASAVEMLIDKLVIPWAGHPSLLICASTSKDRMSQEHPTKDIKANEIRAATWHWANYGMKSSWVQMEWIWSKKLKQQTKEMTRHHDPIHPKLNRAV
jgi:hypothetical protein